MSKKRKSLLWEYTEAIVTALILALIIRAYIIQAFKIPTGSMIPTLLIGDHLLVNKMIYGTKLPFTDKRVLVFKKPERGDIIVFRYPEDPDRDFIKRIVGVGGDLVEGKGKAVFVNGKQMEETYIRHTDSSAIDKRDNFGPFLVPEGKIFVMGDNRDQSYDSRFWGYVDIDEIKGKALIIYWSSEGLMAVPKFGRIGRLVK